MIDHWPLTTDRQWPVTTAYSILIFDDDVFCCVEDIDVSFGAPHSTAGIYSQCCIHFSWRELFSDSWPGKYPDDRPDPILIFVGWFLAIQFYIWYSTIRIDSIDTVVRRKPYHSDDIPWWKIPVFTLFPVCSSLWRYSFLSVVVPWYSTFWRIPTLDIPGSESGNAITIPVPTTTIDAEFHSFWWWFHSDPHSIRYSDILLFYSPLFSILLTVIRRPVLVKCEGIDWRHWWQWCFDERKWLFWLGRYSRWLLFWPDSTLLFDQAW